jgi:hypothetical protein
MGKSQLYFVTASSLLGLMVAGTAAQGSVRVGIGLRFGFPAYYRPWGPCYPYYYPYYPPYPAVYVAPAPVYIPAPPVAAAPVPVAQPAYRAASTPPPPEVLPQPRHQEGVEQLLGQLANPDERTRGESVLQLGRLKARQAVDPLAATLAGDRSPIVREAAARALGLVGSTSSLPALQQAASADPDHDVRHSARFAIDVIQSGR